MNLTLKINNVKIGAFLTYIYIFMSFNANGINIPTVLTSITLYGLLFFYIYYTIIKRYFVIRTYSKWYFQFMVLSIIIMSYSSNGFDLGGEYYLMIVSFLITLIVIEFIQDEKAFSKLCWVYIISSFVLVVTLYLSGQLIATASNRLGLELMGNANIFANMMMVATFYGLWLLVYGTKKTFVKILLIFALLMNMYALTLSAGRKYFVLPFVFLYILLLTKTDRKGRRHIIKYTVIIVAIVIVAAVLVMNVPMFYDTIGYRFQLLINGYINHTSMGASADVRNYMRSSAIKEWLHSPIWGYGFDSFKYYALENIGEFYYSHCNYSELLYCGGIIYFISYYSVFYILSKAVVRAKNAPTEYKAFCIAVMVCSLLSDYGGISYSSATAQILLALSFQVLSFPSRNENNKEIAKNG